MNIDRIARNMTACGPSGPAWPRAGFTARVMAPIYGHPRPGFTARVMSRLDEPVGRSFSSGIGRALILIPAAIALAAGLAVLRASRVVAPSLPDAPRLARADRDPGVPSAPPATYAAGVGRTPRRAAQQETVLPDAPSIYMIAALDGPADITTKSIDPAARTIPALDAPAPLKIPDLPGNAGGSQPKEFKEKS